MVDKSILFSGNSFSDIFCYSNTVNDGWFYSGILIAVFVIVLAYGYKRNYQAPLVFFATSFITFILSSIFLLGGKEIGCQIISEQNYIIWVLIFVASIINYVFNRQENV